MARDILTEYSNSELKQFAEKAEQISAVTEYARTFVAVIREQGFNAPPSVLAAEDLDNVLSKEGGIELNRGLSSAYGIPAAKFAHELLKGEMYHGTQIAFGHGIYFAEPGSDGPSQHFKRISETARHYASSSAGGIVVRCALRQNAQIIDIASLRERFKEMKNRALRARIFELGAFAAASGFDAYHMNDKYLHNSERVWVVVNRSALIFQMEAFRTDGSATNTP